MPLHFLPSFFAIIRVVTRGQLDGVLPSSNTLMMVEIMRFICKAKFSDLTPSSFLVYWLGGPSVSLFGSHYRLWALYCKFTHQANLKEYIRFKNLAQNNTFGVKIPTNWLVHAKKAVWCSTIQDKVRHSTIKSNLTLSQLSCKSYANISFCYIY